MFQLTRQEFTHLISQFAISVRATAEPFLVKKIQAVEPVNFVSRDIPSVMPHFTLQVVPEGPSLLSAFLPARVGAKQLDDINCSR